MAQLCLWTEILTKQWLVLGASAFQCMRSGFLCPKCDNFACFHTRQDQNDLHVKRWLFFAKIDIFCKSIADPLSEAKTHWMANWLQPEPIELCITSYQSLYAKFVPMMFPKCLIVENDSELMLMALHTHFLPQQQYSRVYSLFLAFHASRFIDEDASFFHSFHKITNIRSWRCFSSSKIRTQFSHTFCNISMIFKVMSQYFPALFKRIQNHICSAKG